MKNLLILLFVSFLMLPQSQAQISLWQKAKLTCQMLLHKKPLILPDGQTLRQAIKSTPELRVAIEELEAGISKAVRSQRRNVRSGEIKATYRLENFLGLISEGQVDTVLNSIRPHLYRVRDLVIKINEVWPQLQKLEQISDLTKVQKREYFQLEREYRLAISEFGEKYGWYLAVIRTLNSVSQGQGLHQDNNAFKTLDDEFVLKLPGAVDAASDSTASPTLKQVNQYVKENVYTQYDMTTPAAISAAQRALEILKSSSLPNVKQMRTIFAHHPMALVAKLNQDLKESKYDQRWDVKTFSFLSATYIRITDKIPFIPDQLRPAITMAAGIQYNKFMISKYLGGIQRVINIARARDLEGNVVYLTSSDVLDAQIRLMLDLNALSPGNEFLNTFARVPYFTDIWAKVRARVAIKASEEGNNEGRAYSLLGKRMDEAVKARETLGEMPYLEEPNYSYDLQFAIAQGAWAVLWYNMYGVRDHIPFYADYIAPFLTFLSNP